MSRVVHATAADYSHGAETVRGHVANALQIVQDMLTELREREGEPFLLGAQDDLNGVRMRLQYALNILDAR